MSAYSNTTRVLNGTKPSNCSSPDNLSAKIGKTFAYCLLLTVSLAGNSFIGILVYKTKTMRKTINFMIVNMAVSDLLFTIFALPLILAELHADSWLIRGVPGEALCKLEYFLQDISTAVSVQSMVLITVDRFGAVVFPLRSPLITSKLCLVFIPATWIVASAVFTPYLFALKLVENRGDLTCALRWKEAFGKSSSEVHFMLAVSAVFLYIPFALMLILYSIIIIKLKTKKLPGEQSLKAEKQHSERHRNALKMAIAIVLGFAICWIPLSVFNVLYLFVWDNSTALPFSIMHYRFIASFIARANCAVNPCICFTFSENYRRGLKSLFNCSGGLKNSRKSYTELYSIKSKDRLVHKTANNYAVSGQRSNYFVMISTV
ncbi:neuropeptide FF receptor 2-like [Orbicella faveolata]|uniref:neuropeptide FF receptor 2-like n=1 Tax=Orbicella faveolata TaxID=48498 RepID=UPI0009E5207E|nr:neuropeptide FF receptor 2-like [Orbicella faveolata]